MFKSKFFVMICLLFAALSFIVISCDSTSMNTSKGQIEVVQDPIIEEVEEVEGVRVISSTNVAYFMYSMIPQGVPSTAAVGGSTQGSEIITIDDVDYVDFKIISASSSSLGFFSQGKWHLTLYLLDSAQKLIVRDPVVDQDYFLNTFSNTIDINLDDILFPTDQNCSLKLNNLKLELVGDPSMYNKEELGGYVISINLKSLYDSSVNITKSIESFSSFETNVDGREVVGVVNDFEISKELLNGAYTISIKLLEHNGSEYIEAGGMAFSFHARGTTCDIVSSGSALSLKASDYVTPGLGDSGIIVDQGTANTVDVTASIGDTAIDSKTSVSVNNTVTFKADVKVNNEKVTVQNGKWLVDGVVQPNANGSTFSYTPSGKAGKTVTITYMFLDNTSYNTISGNFYLSVKST